MYIKLIKGRYFGKQLYYAGKVYKVTNEEGSYLLSVKQVDGKPYFRQMIPKTEEVDVVEPVKRKPGRPKKEVKPEVEKEVKTSDKDESGVVDEEPVLESDKNGVVAEEEFDEQPTEYEEAEQKEVTEEFDPNESEVEV